MPYKWRLIADTTEKRFIKLYNSVAVLKDIENMNKRCKYLDHNIDVLVKNPSFDGNVFAIKQMNDEQKQIYQQQINKEHRDRVKTFAELFDDIKVLEKQFKNTTKMSLKQLEAKKKERLTINPEVNIYAKPTNQDEKYDKFKVMEGSKLFEIYESAVNPKLKLSETGKQWEEMLETDLRNMKTERLKKAKRQADTFKSMQSPYKMKMIDRELRPKKSFKILDAIEKSDIKPTKPAKLKLSGKIDILTFFRYQKGWHSSTLLFNAKFYIQD